MTLPTEIDDYLKYIVQRLKRTMPVSAIYLFGSYAKGTYNEHSDLDIFVVTPDKSKRRIDWIRKASGAINKSWGKAVEIIVNYDDDFKRRSKAFYTIEREVIETGEKIYGKRRRLQRMAKKSR